MLWSVPNRGQLRTTSYIKPDDEEFPSLDRAMMKHIQKGLIMAKGKVEGKGGAAELLEINPRTLRHRMKKLGIPFGRKVKRKNQTDPG